MLGLGFFAVALAALALGLGRWSFGVLALLAGLAGIAQPVPTSGWTAQLPRVVTSARLGGAYGVDAATYSVGMIAGPGLAGAAFAAAHRAPLLVPATFLLAAILVLARVRIAPSTHDEHHDSSLRRGFSVLLRSPTLYRTSIVSTIGFAGQAAFVASAPVVSRTLGAGLNLVGPLLVSMAVGGLLSTLYLARRPVGDPDRWVELGTWIVAVGFVIMVISPSVWLALIGGFVIGTGDGPMFTATLRVRAREAPPAVRGQVFATAASLRVGAYALALAGFGALLAHGPNVVLWCGAVVQLVAIGLGRWLPGLVRAAAPDGAG